ncbi:prolipoprotein diacylglyceryl transferase [Mucisphaera sp.]|uniref:prolipoprotein diacylglyceryl transferase n=1 Tax=Mucisphaera sp. TaxID=2913024 RepID=UPI003D0BBEA2
MLHTLDPIAFTIPGIGLPIRWYGLAYLTGFLLAFILVRRVLTVGRSPLKPDLAADLIIHIALGLVAGGRVGYVLFYKPHLLLEFTAEPPFWSLIAINRGGMSSHGGMLGAIFAAWLFARRNSVPLRHILDLAAFSAPLGIFLGRVANYIGGELYGRATSADFRWATRFPQELLDFSAEQLAPLMAQAPDLGNEPLLWAYRAIDRVQKNDPRIIEIVEPALTPRHPSQLYAATLEGLVLFAVLAAAWLKPRKPGFIAGLFCCTYAIARIINEQFRMPDAHLLNSEYAALGITRGQWLSALLFLLGLYLIRQAHRCSNEPLGSWVKQATT